MKHPVYYYLSVGNRAAAAGSAQEAAPGGADWPQPPLLPLRDRSPAGARHRTLQLVRQQGIAARYWFALHTLLARRRLTCWPSVAGRCWCWWGWPACCCGCSSSPRPPPPASPARGRGGRGHGRAARGGGSPSARRIQPLALERYTTGEQQLQQTFLEMS